MQHDTLQDSSSMDTPPTLGKRRYQRCEQLRMAPPVAVPYGGVDDFDPKTIDDEQGNRGTADTDGPAARRMSLADEDPTSSEAEEARPEDSPAPGAKEHEGQSANKKAKRTSMRGPSVRGQDALSLREYVAKQPEFQTLITAGFAKDILRMIMEVGIKMEGQGLEVLFEEGPMDKFCDAIADINGSSRKEVKKSKMKMVKKWKEQRNAERYFICGEGAKLVASNITLTVDGKKNLLMHIDADADGLTHNIETMFRDEAADVINKVRHFSRELRSHVQIANECSVATKHVHEESKKKFRQQKEMVCEREGLTETQAINKLRGVQQFLNRGLFPVKTTPDGEKMRRKDGTVVTHTAIEMAQAATGKTKAALYKRGLSEIANEPVHHAQHLQRSAMTYRMSALGEDAVKAAKAVGSSGGIDMMKLLGIDENDPDSVTKLAAVCYDKVTGIEHFGKQKQHQQLLQVANE